ncbi:MFS transporter [Pseudooceanicola aestuarii]|uniref:MFS transporter n=1 Tax=Pseudooceanicola aestuarii TaxID=2697319 RepID=UPI0013D698C2|nr:MFS transporter [Pseudooceanicola aestuarii]
MTPKLPRPGRTRSLLLLLLAEIGAMSLWFVSAAILPELTREAQIGPWRAGLLSTAVQLGFVLGAVALALHGTSDRFDPRRVFAASALVASAATMGLLVTPPGGIVQILLRGLTGLCLAGVYPVGMKIAVGWTLRRRGLVVGLLVAALTLGSAAPHGLALLGGADWRITVTLAALLSALAAGLVLMARLGPHHATAPRFDPATLRLAWTDRPLRLAYAGYLCHMWELYAFWAWIGVALTASLTLSGAVDPATTARLTTFVAIGLGGLVCVPAGALADRIGKARVAGAAMGLSGAFALATAAAFGGPPALIIALVIGWGICVIPDSAQFSALVADHAPADRAGSLMTFQTALGFLLTAFTIQTAPLLAAAIGWPVTLAVFGIGPLLGVEAMRRLHRLSRSTAHHH